MPRITITLDVPEGTTVSVDTGTTPAQPPVTPPGSPPVSPPAPAGSAVAFAWSESGAVRQEDFGAGSTKVYAITVPEDYAGNLVGNISQNVSGTPEYSQVALWFSETPEGPAFSGDIATRNPEPSYRGATGQMGLGTPDRWRPPKGKTVYFNVTASGRWNVRLIHG